MLKLEHGKKYVLITKEVVGPLKHIKDLTPANDADKKFILDCQKLGYVFATEPIQLNNIWDANGINSIVYSRNIISEFSPQINSAQSNATEKPEKQIWEMTLDDYKQAINKMYSNGGWLQG